jgi:hypothetical protein
MIVKTSSGHMVKCWIPKIFFTNPSTEPSKFKGENDQENPLTIFSCISFLSGR